MKFNYQARTKTGEIQSGTVEATTEEAAISVLQKHNLFVTYLEKVEAAPLFTKKIRIFGRVSKKEVIVFSRQLGILLKSEVPPIEALHALADQTNNPLFKEKILRISGEIEGGTSLSQALSFHPKLFSAFYVSIVKSGEASGNLPTAIENLAVHLDGEAVFRSKIIGAMIYPIFVLGVFLIILTAMIMIVIPNLAQIITTTGVEPPLISRIVFKLSDFLRKWGGILFISILVLTVVIFRYSRTVGGKKFFDKNLLRVPLLKSLLQRIYLARLAENLSTLVAGGLPIARALEITGEIVGNSVYKAIVLETRDEVRKGEKISAVFGRYPRLVSPLFVQMTTIGEKTGRLDAALLNIVEFYRKEVDRGLDNFMRLLEPILIVLLGLTVAGLVGAVLLPLYSQIGSM